MYVLTSVVDKFRVMSKGATRSVAPFDIYIKLLVLNWMDEILHEVFF